MHDVDMGVWREPTKMTMEQWLEIWLKDYQSHTSKRTVNKYKSIVKQFNKSVRMVKVVKLSPLHVRRMVSKMQEDDLTAATIQMYMRVFKTALNCAIEAGLIKENPAQKMKLPKSQPRKFCIVDREQIPAFIKAANQTRYGNELILMLLTGLRIGELRGLRWSDIDLEASTIDIQRQLQPTHKSMERFTLPKYDEVRLLHVAPQVVILLREQKKKQAEQRLAKGGDWIEDDISKDLVFRQTSGKAHTRGTISRTVTTVGKAIGLPDLHPHDLRHSYAIAALRSGANIKSVQYNLGHKTAKMTLDVYAAYTEDTGKTDAAKLSTYLQNLSN
jgi:integrase